MEKTKEITRNLGGDRLGSGAKNNINLHSYNRSTHDLSRTWRSTMNVGTLVPFLMELGLNGDSCQIDLDNITRTMPSLGPLYGSYKLQLDVFECPIRLYNGLLHNNMTGIGLNMSQVKFPKIELSARVRRRDIYNENLNNSQISKSSLINYLGLNGIGDAKFENNETERVIRRKFNAIPLIAYWDIYKNYYANKQEEKGAFIVANPIYITNTAKKIVTYGASVNPENKPIEKKLELIEDDSIATNTEIYEQIEGGERINLISVGYIEIKEFSSATQLNQIKIVVFDSANNTAQTIALNNIAQTTEVDTNGDIKITLNRSYGGNSNYELLGIVLKKEQEAQNSGLNIATFDLEEIDNMRIAILQNTGLNNELQIENVSGELWESMVDHDTNETTLFKYGQHGLALKTYQSDLYNNWLQTEWIDGANGINKITAIDTSSGSFEIDAFILSKKIYNMLNRVAVSGGSYEDWQEAVYSVKAVRRAETPIYRGGMSAEIMFSEVVSNAATEDEPLGTLAGKGGEHGKKGGQIEISCDEPCIIMGIVSLTPRVDYSQGNSWIMTELDNMDDLHKPALDGIGFEDLLQERMAYWGTVVDTNGDLTKMAAGKIPAWMNYMTAVNETHGEFAEEDKCMFMTLNRRYQFTTASIYDNVKFGITDLTTYIDPAKYNYIFADASLEAQNFWVQIGVRFTARRVMSAKVIPFL